MAHSTKRKTQRKRNNIKRRRAIKSERRKNVAA